MAACIAYDINGLLFINAIFFLGTLTEPPLAGIIATIFIVLPTWNKRYLFFKDFKELYSDRITSNPVKFPGFRDAIEQALDDGITPCGVVTGMATFVNEENIKNDKSNSKKQKNTYKIGLVMSNVKFQAGAFDMASCEKVCRLLDDCARLKFPVIFFISSIFTPF